MLNAVYSFLNKTTMYRLLVYYLGGLLGVAAVFSALHILPYDPINVLMSAGFLAAVCWLGTLLFARIWRVPTNAESALITALILSLIITPGMPDASFFFLMWAGLLAMASKYILAVRGKHVFNPAAFGVAATALFINQSATWWVAGNLAMLPFVLAGGFLVVRKIRRSDLVLTFIIIALISSLAFTPLTLGDLFSGAQTVLLHTSVFFFAFVMLTEPLTTPPRRLGRMLYAAFVGCLFAPWVHIGSFYFTPELALIAGNLFSYLISPKFKAVLKLTEIRQLAADTYEFVFAGKAPKFAPGQYAEWTLGTEASDSRGNRRYFTLASSPTEQDVKLGIKFYANPSTYKTDLAKFVRGSELLAGSIAGDFTLPRSKKKKLVFIAGGIGVTPFRSIAKYLTDAKEKRDVVMFYSNRTPAEIAYKDVFDEAERTGTGFKTIYTVTDNVPATWMGERGYIDANMIAKKVPDYKERTFYISGPHGMVDALAKTLRQMGVSRWRIKTDFFPGFA
jgi:ferredoxin-NADP reductase/Na+-translocating ferredoxin:NAD+ oxidoreductase RnfD subunit